MGNLILHFVRNPFMFNAQLITRFSEPFGNELRAVVGAYNRLGEVFFLTVVSYSP